MSHLGKNIFHIYPLPEVLLETVSKGDVPVNLLEQISR